jgi:hypothetical protein
MGEKLLSESESAKNQGNVVSKLHSDSRMWSGSYAIEGMDDGNKRKVTSPDRRRPLLIIL